MPKKFIDSFIHLIDQGIWDNDKFIYKSITKSYNDSDFYICNSNFTFEDIGENTLIKFDLELNILYENTLIPEIIIAPIISIIENFVIYIIKENFNRTCDLTVDYINNRIYT